MHLFLEEYNFNLVVPNSLAPVHTHCCDIAAVLRNNLILLNDFRHLAI